MDGPPPARVTDFTFSDRNTDSELTLMCNNIRIQISISAADLSPSSIVRKQYLHFLRVADAYELDGLTVDDFYDWVIDGCAGEFLKLASPPGHLILTLQDFINPKTFYYILQATEEDKLALLPSTEASSGVLPMGVDLPEELCCSWPFFDPSLVRMCTDDSAAASSQFPHKVSIDGTHPFFFKPYRRCDGALAKHEIHTYAKIRDARLQGVQISRAFGLVRNKAGTIFGLLLSYIESRAVTLTSAVRSDTLKSVRENWARQIDQTLSSLHAAGIIWGDAKPDNVLIDTKANAWIIDFGGGYTSGWVHPDVAGTVEGDLQGLSKIIDYINTQR